METTTNAATKITVEATVNAPVEIVWKTWSEPQHIKQWCAASDDWHAPKAENDLRTGGTFSTRMEAKDGSFGFDFGGVYDNVKKNELIEYTMGDGRKVRVIFTPTGDITKIVETFDAETTNPVDMQRTGWQAILDNFKKYTESI
ncbi:MAG TPA: SRPBCC family protein [Chitinophagaceae bacterium]|nr:SRPBCC family protein [Chitinophagaceae bacterium]